MCGLQLCWQFVGTDGTISRLCRTHLAHFVHHLLDLLLIHPAHACLGCREHRAVALPARGSCGLPILLRSMLAIVLLFRLLRRRWVCLSLMLLHPPSYSLRLLGMLGNHCKAP
jgi:hypothetical protein